jgi:hypothetical protein
VLKNAAKCGIQFSLAGKKLKRRLSHLLSKSLYISHLFMKLKVFINFSCPRYFEWHLVKVNERVKNECCKYMPRNGQETSPDDQ